MTKSIHDRSSQTLYLEEQRREVRISSRQVAIYVKSRIGKDNVEFEEGQVMIFNESLNGCLLQMPRSVSAGDIIEVQSQQSDKQITTLWEACWSHPWDQSFEPQYHLVGCRRLFTYWPSDIPV